jgi:hypothetical protein
MQTPDTIEQQADEAMARINQQINRSAGQHLRAVRRVRAGQPVLSEGTASAQNILRNVPLAPLHQAQTDPPPDTRSIARCGEPTEEEIEEAKQPKSGMQMLTYLLIALAVAGLVLAVFLLMAAQR